MSLMKCSTKKPGSKLPAMIRGPRFVEAPRPGRPAGDALHHGVQVEPGLVAVEQRLADADHVGGDQDLVDHLGVLARAGRALVDDRLAHGLEERLQGLDDLLVAADHDRQPGFSRADVAAGDRRVDRVHALAPSRPVTISTASAGSLVVMSTSMVPGFAPARTPLLAQDHLAHVAGIADDGEDHVRGLGHLLRRGGDRRPPCRPAAWSSRRCGCRPWPGSRPSIRCPHIDEPMTPVPIQPIRVFPGANSSAMSGSRRNVLEASRVDPAGPFRIIPSVIVP